MLKHIVLIKFKPETPRAEIEKIIQGLQGLPKHISEIRAYEVEEDVVHTPRSFDLAIVGLFDDVASLKRYQAHPKHQLVLAALNANATQIVTADYEAAIFQV